MANQQHVAFLRKSITDWNRWRRNHLAIHPDLSGATLNQADFCKANLSNANLSKAELSGANIPDLLKYLRGISNPYRFLANPPHKYGGGVDLQDLELIDHEVRQLIYELGDRTLLQTAQTLNAHFFAISATGSSPKMDGTFAAVEPCRCLDPVLWTLQKLRITMPGECLLGRVRSGRDEGR